MFLITWLQFFLKSINIQLRYGCQCIRLSKVIFSVYVFKDQYYRTGLALHNPSRAITSIDCLHKFHAIWHHIVCSTIKSIYQAVWSFTTGSGEDGTITGVQTLSFMATGAHVKHIFSKQCATHYASVTIILLSYH